jgi:N-acetyl-gamma-glutamyl-phosphate reductase
MTKVFIDGSAGTTGLQIYERLAGRRDVSLLTLPEARRKDPEARRVALNGCDIAFLCLPDAAAREAVAMVTEPQVKIIDASTAHRTAPGWIYGFPELFPGRREEIVASKRVANPGCHASGFVALVVPLLRAGLLSPDAALCCHSLTGYSGGGKAMIAAYEAEGRSRLLDAPRLYALGQQHKHLAGDDGHPRPADAADIHAGRCSLLQRDDDGPAPARLPAPLRTRRPARIV